jgi:catechol 2,3-dioxygenase-like lactoylglutathione lyase family enzyme
MPSRFNPKEWIMTDFSFVLLYVANPVASAAFYEGLLGKPPIDVAPTFAMLPLNDRVKLGLWLRSDVAPAATVAPGGNEIAFTVPDASAVHATYSDWCERGLQIAQQPTAMDFGHTFVALDPDGHRLRVFAPSGS